MRERVNASFAESAEETLWKADVFNPKILQYYNSESSNSLENASDLFPTCIDVACLVSMDTRGSLPYVADAADWIIVVRAVQL